MGCGLCCVVPQADAAAAQRHARRAGDRRGDRPRGRGRGRRPRGAARRRASRPSVGRNLREHVIGTLLNDRFRLEEKIGSGGMSTVYRAFDETLERWVAIKLMHREISSDSDQLERFRREARAVAQPQPPARRHGHRLRRGRRPPLHRLRVRRGREPEGPHPARRAAAGPRGGRLRDRDRPRARVRALEQARPPRREAAERPDRLRGPRQGHRLRDRALARGGGADRDRARARHHRLRRPRAGARRGHDRAVRRLLARDLPVRDAHRRRPVQGGQPGGGRDEAREGPAAGHPDAPAGDLGGARVGRRDRVRQGDREPLRQRARDGPRARAGARDRDLALGRGDRRGHDGAALAARRHGGVRRAQPAAAPAAEAAR